MAGTPAPEANPISKPLFHDDSIYFPTKCNFKHYSFYFVIINVTDGFVKGFKENYFWDSQVRSSPLDYRKKDFGQIKTLNWIQGLNYLTFQHIHPRFSLSLLHKQPIFDHLAQKSFGRGLREA